MDKRNSEDRSVMIIDANPINQADLCRGVLDFDLLFPLDQKGLAKIASYVRKMKPSVILLGFRFPGTGDTGADIARYLRAHHYRGIIAGNSPGGRKVFENRGVELDFYVNQRKRVFLKLLERIRQGTIKPRRRGR